MTDPAALLHDFKELQMTLRTRRIPCTLEWDGEEGKKEILRLLPLGRHASGGLLMGGTVQKTKHAMSYYHEDVRLLPGSRPPVGTFMILTVFETIGPEKNRRGRSRDVTSVKYTGMRVNWQYAGLVVVPAGKNCCGEECWRRVGVFMFSGDVDNPQEVNSPFDLRGGEDEDIILV